MPNPTTNFASLYKKIFDLKSKTEEEEEPEQNTAAEEENE